MELIQPLDWKKKKGLWIQMKILAQVLLNWDLNMEIERKKSMHFSPLKGTLEEQNKKPQLHLQYLVIKVKDKPLLHNREKAGKMIEILLVSL